MVTLAGTVARLVLLLLRVTRAPPLGAGPFSVSVAVDEVPPRTLVGLSVTELRLRVCTVSVADAVAPSVAEILTLVFAETVDVVIVKFAVVAPAATVTAEGTCADPLLLLARVTEIPPVGALPLRVIVPVELLPPSRDVGDKLTDCAWGGFTVRFADALLVP
jgi:hypothetical protein